MIKKREAFTLIEIIIVMMIFVLIMGILMVIPTTLAREQRNLELLFSETSAVNHLRSTLKSMLYYMDDYSELQATVVSGSKLFYYRTKPPTVLDLGTAFYDDFNDTLGIYTNNPNSWTGHRGTIYKAGGGGSMPSPNIAAGRVSLGNFQTQNQYNYFKIDFNGNGISIPSTQTISFRLRNKKDSNQENAVMRFFMEKGVVDPFNTGFISSAHSRTPTGSWDSALFDNQEYLNVSFQLTPGNYYFLWHFRTNTGNSTFTAAYVDDIRISDFAPIPEIYRWFKASTQTFNDYYTFFTAETTNSNIPSSGAWRLVPMSYNLKITGFNATPNSEDPKMLNFSAKIDLAKSGGLSGQKIIQVNSVSFPIK